MMPLGSFRARSLVLALTVLGGPGDTPRVTLQAPTQRLRLTINPATLRVGETARLTVDFLDSQFRPVANDRNRTIDFAQLPSGDRKSTRLNSSHLVISYAVFCLKKKKRQRI